MWPFVTKIESVDKYKSGYFNATKEGWAELNKDKLMYAIEESRLLSQTLWDAHGHLVHKIAFLLGIVVALIGYIFTTLIFHTKFIEGLSWYEEILVLIYIALLIYTFFNLLKYQCPLWSLPVGTPPKDLLKGDVMDCELDKIFVKQLERYQDRICSASRQNNTMADALEVSYWMLVIYPIAVIMIYSFCSLCSSLFK